MSRALPCPRALPAWLLGAALWLVPAIAWGLPRPFVDRWFSADKWVHLTISAAVASAACRASGYLVRRRVACVLAGLAVASAAGVAKEVSDLYLGQDFSYKDVVWDVVGAVVGVGLSV
jgi:uncharacterized protein YfiM (DUF2279 family)